MEVRQKGCTKTAEGVKYLSIAAAWTEGGVVVRERITDSISETGGVREGGREGWGMWRTWVVHFYGVSRRMGTDLGGGELYVLQVL